ncbi:MAG: hypothetical protein WC444_05440 [Candidatus Paceibacterota bacterium]
MVVVKKIPVPPEEKLSHLLTGTDEALSDEDRVELIKKKFNLAKNATPDHEDLQREMNSYDIKLSETPDVTDFSDINKKYALAQAWISRVNTIEMACIYSESAWKDVFSSIKSFIDKRTSEILMESEVGELKNARMQEASVRNRLGGVYDALLKIESEYNKSKSFTQIVQAKSKELTSVITNLTRQVKTLSLEYTVTRDLNRS